jgi:hypothetical protein
VVSPPVVLNGTDTMVAVATTSPLLMAKSPDAARRLVMTALFVTLLPGTGLGLRALACPGWLPEHQCVT